MYKGLNLFSLSLIEYLPQPQSFVSIDFPDIFSRCLYLHIMTFILFRTRQHKSGHI